MQCAARARLGRQARSCSSSTATATGSTGTTPSCTLIDLQYADVRPDKGLYHRLVGRGRIERLARRRGRRCAPCTSPPEDTRAYFRGRCLEQYADARRRGLLGLGDLRPARPRSRSSGCPTHRPAARQPGARRATLLDRCDTAPAARWLDREPDPRLGSERTLVDTPSRSPTPARSSVEVGSRHGPGAASNRKQVRRDRGRPTEVDAAPRPRPSARSRSTRTSTRSSTRSTTCWRPTPRTS